MGCDCKDVEAIARASAEIVGARTRKRTKERPVHWTPEREAEFERQHGRPRRTTVRGGAHGHEAGSRT